MFSRDSETSSGWQKIFYGKMGEVTQNIHTFALPNESTPYPFKTQTRSYEFKNQGYKE